MESSYLVGFNKLYHGIQLLISQIPKMIFWQNNFYSNFKYQSYFAVYYCGFAFIRSMPKKLVFAIWCCEKIKLPLECLITYVITKLKSDLNLIHLIKVYLKLNKNKVASIREIGKNQKFSFKFVKSVGLYKHLRSLPRYFRCTLKFKILEWKICLGQYFLK